jgi:hypothetical protein
MEGKTMFKRFACRAVERALPDYVTGRLSAEQRDRIERHLATCRNCGERRQSLQQATEFAADADRDAFPNSLTSWEDLRAQIEMAPPILPSRRRMAPIWIADAATVAACSMVVACAVGLIVWSIIPRPHRMTPSVLASRRSHPDIHRQPDVHRMVVQRISPHTMGQERRSDGAHHTVMHRNDSRAAIPAAVGLEMRPAQQTMRPDLALQEAPMGETEPGKPGAAASAQPVQPPLPGLHTPEPAASAPAQRVATAPTSDLAYLNADAETGLKQWTPRPPSDLRQVEEELMQRVKGGDSFVTAPLPPIAGQGADAVKAAVAEQRREATIVDTRLVRKVSVQAKALSFFDLCERLRRQAGVRVTANRCVADDKITLYCHPRPLRDLMRQISRQFGFTWVRKGEEGSYEYELTQTLRSKLLEEGMRERDEEQMLLAIDRAMEPYRRYSGMSLAQLNALPANVARADLQPLFQLQHGGLAAMNLYFALSRQELDTLRSGQPLKLDLKSSDAALLTAGVMDGIRNSFSETYERERLLAAQGGEHPPIPDASSPLTATLQLDRSKPGEFTLKGELSDGQTGLGSQLAVAKSPAYEVHNARDNAALAHDPALQGVVAIKPAATCKVVKTRYPDTEGLNETVGDKATTADVMEAIYQATGMDVMADYYSHLYDPAPLLANNLRLFDALNRIGDRMRMRWTRQDGWLQFRTSTFYYDRPQEVPNRLLERWQTARARQGALTPDDLAEIAELPDAQLDSLWMAQGAEAIYGLSEWQMASNTQLRPHWRFLARLSDEQRHEAGTEAGLDYTRLTPEQKLHFLDLAYDGDPNHPGYNQIPRGSLRLLYALSNHPISEGASYAILPSNPILFIYSCDPPGERRHIAVVGPFNAIYGMLEYHLTPQSLEVVPPPEEH